MTSSSGSTGQHMWPWYGQFEVSCLQPFQLRLSPRISWVTQVLVSRDRDLGHVQPHPIWFESAAGYGSGPVASNLHSGDMPECLCHGQGSLLLAGPLFHFPQCHNSLLASRDEHVCVCHSITRGCSWYGKYSGFQCLPPQSPASRIWSQSSLLHRWIQIETTINFILNHCSQNMSFLLLHLDVISIVSTESALWMLMVWYYSTKALFLWMLMAWCIGTRAPVTNSAEPRHIVLPEVSFLNSWLLTQMYLHLDNRCKVTLQQLRLFWTSDLKCAGISDYTCVIVPAYNSCVHWVTSELYECWWPWVSACGQAATAVVNGPELIHQVYLSGLYWDKSANSYLMPLGYTCWLISFVALDAGIRFHFAYHPSMYIRLWVYKVDADGLSLGIRASATTVRTGT